MNILRKAFSQSEEEFRRAWGTPADTWDSTAEDLARARRELATMERAPGEGRVADEQAWLDACANKRLWITRLEAESGE